jgi:hypothetical protein
MQKITNRHELKIAIQQLERQQMEEWVLLKDEYKDAFKNLKSENETEHFDESTDFKNELLGTGLSIAAGYFSRKIVPDFLPGSLKRLCKTVIQMGVTNFVSKHTDEMKLAGKHFVHHILGKKIVPSLVFEETLNHADNIQGRDDTKQFL